VTGLTIAEALRRRIAISDAEFDELFPLWQRLRSGFHWTPVDVALRAATLLAPDASTRVLDIGAGVGKLCLIGALTTEASWSGIERDPKMVHAATAAARKLGVADRVRFSEGEVVGVDWDAFDAFYLFNPFAERLIFAADAAPIRRDIYHEHIALVQRQLARTRPGTRVVTYHGFGADELPGFDLVLREPARNDHLCLWVRGAW
jgi:SAM-dependent methyltransferase